MAVTHHALVRNSIADTVLAAIDQDAAAGKLQFQTAASAEVATLNLSYPAGIVTGETLAFSTITSDTNATAGTVSKFVITDNSGNEILYGTVTAPAGGGDIELSSLAVGGGDTVSCSALSYTAPL